MISFFLRRLVIFGGTFTMPDPPPPDEYTPSLDFSDARNSQHYIMGWWI